MIASGDVAVSATISGLFVLQLGHEGSRAVRAECWVLRFPSTTLAGEVSESGNGVGPMTTGTTPGASCTIAPLRSLKVTRAVRVRPK
jgi:hypothetical protein